MKSQETYLVTLVPEESIVYAKRLTIVTSKRVAITTDYKGIKREILRIGKTTITAPPDTHFIDLESRPKTSPHRRSRFVTT